MLTSETKRRIDAARDVLVGKLPLPTDQVELITLALVYKFMDDLDEDSVAIGGQRTFFSGALAPYRWRALTPATLSADERVRLFSEGLESLGHPKRAAHLPELFRDLFRNAFLKFRDGRILTLFLAEIDGFAYSHSEELGNAFEYLLSTMGAQGDNGQFRTPRHLIEFIVACLDPRPGERILDPACGTGGFLVSAYRHILRAHTTPGSALPGDRLSHTQRERLHAAFTGYDITDLMVKLSKVNLFLHHFPSPDIHIYDTLSNDARWAERFDLILANPPFMTPKGGVTPHARFRIPAKKAEVLFTDYIAEHLDVNGRAGIVVPNGIVATTQTAYVRLRRMLVEESLVAVVSLPSGVFKPYSGVKTSVLFLDKALARRSREVLFLKVNADGFDLGDKRTPIAADDLPTAQRVLTRWFKGELGDEPTKEIPWAKVSRETLLGDADCNLQAEAFLGQAVQLESEHEIVALGDVLEFMRNGCDVEQRDEVGKFRVSRIQSIADGTFDPAKTKWTDDEVAPDRFLQPGDILLSHINSVPHLAKTAIFKGCTEKVIHGINLLCLRPNRDRVLPEFLAAWLKTRTFINKAVSYAKRAVNQASITSSDLKSIEIPLPPLEEQRRIVAEIEGYQQVIDGARQILAAYQIRIEMESEWETRPLGEIAEFIDYRGRTPEKSSAGLPLLTAKNVRWGFIDPEPREFVTEETYEEFMTRGFPKRGDVLFTTEAPMGMAALVDRDDRFALAQRVICLSPKSGLVIGGYLFRVLLSAGVQEALKAASTGSTVLGIKASSLKEIPIPLPPLPEQARIVAELDAEAARLEAVRGLIPAFDAKIARTLARVWGSAAASA